jgi:hypothetical protein
MRSNPFGAGFTRSFWHRFHQLQQEAGDLDRWIRAAAECMLIEVKRSRSGG